MISEALLPCSRKVDGSLPTPQGTRRGHTALLQKWASTRRNGQQLVSRTCYKAEEQLPCWVYVGGGDASFLLATPQSRVQATKNRHDGGNDGDCWFWTVLASHEEYDSGCPHDSDDQRRYLCLDPADEDSVCVCEREITKVLTVMIIAATRQMRE